MQSRIASQVIGGCMSPSCIPALNQQYLSAPQHLPALQHLVFLEREGSCVFSHWLLSIDNIWLKTVRQSAQSLAALSALTQYSFSLEVSMNAVPWGQHWKTAPVHLTSSQCKPGLISLNRLPFVQRKRGKNAFFFAHPYVAHHNPVSHLQFFKLCM